MGIIRAFIAVEIDDNTKQKISGLISSLKKSNADAKWITENQMHLTLKFLGNVDGDRVQKISDALSGASDDLSSFTINFSGIGAFPNLNHPAVIWLGVNKGAESLKMLNERIETALEKLDFEAPRVYTRGIFFFASTKRKPRRSGIPFAICAYGDTSPAVCWRASSLHRRGIPRRRVKKEPREFKPHLTLARMRSSKNTLNLVKLIKETDLSSWGDLRINRIALIQSDLNPKGAVYTVLSEKYLKGI